MRWPVQSAAQSGAPSKKLRGAESVGQHDAQRAFVRLLPHLEHVVLRSLQRFVIGRQRGEHHGDLMRVGANRFEIVLVREEGVRGSGEAAAQIRRHGFDHIFLPEKTVTTPGSEIGDAQMRNSAQALDLAPQFGLRLRVQNVEAELAEAFSDWRGFAAR